MKNKYLFKNGKSNLLYKDIKEFNIIFLLLIGLILIGISGYSSYAIFSNEIVSDNEIKAVVKQDISGAEAIIKKVGTDGLVADTHPATTQLAATTAYRYTGANPNNYVKFNNEVWRIIGVFDTDDGKGNLEKRIKIIRDSIGNIAWDSSSNNWPVSASMKLLNSGDYWNRTGSYATNGLTADAKLMIADAKWYLGGVLGYTTSSDGLASHFYGYERGTTVYSGNQTDWVGKVGLMYVSDYGYATSGDSIKNRVSCLSKELNNWGTSSTSSCTNNDWLFDSANTQWTITSSSGVANYSFRIYETGHVIIYNVITSYAIRPTVYLRSDIKIASGTGTSTDPYELVIK